MRLLVALLLLLSLPGLLVPAGFRVRWCHCDHEAPTAATGEACCHHRAAPAEPTCCQRGERSLPPTGTDERLGARDCCSCTWTVVPEHKPDPAPPHAPGTPTPALLAKHCPPLPRALPIATATTRYEPNWHPPPDRQRNLPLLL